MKYKRFNYSISQWCENPRQCMLYVIGRQMIWVDRLL